MLRPEIAGPSYRRSPPSIFHRWASSLARADYLHAELMGGFEHCDNSVRLACEYSAKVPHPLRESCTEPAYPRPAAIYRQRAAVTALRASSAPLSPLESLETVDWERRRLPSEKLKPIERDL